MPSPLHPIIGLTDYRACKERWRSALASILVIDDDPLVRRVLWDILSHAGHTVSTAENGEEGIAMFERGEYDVVFTDLGMSGMSGYQVIRAVRACREQARVIVLTGWPEEIITQALDPQEVQGVLSKPFEADRPIDLVNEVLSLA